MSDVTAAWTEEPRTATRQVVNDLLARARRFHCPVNGTAEYDVTALRQRLRHDRRAGREVSLAAYLLKATATLIAEQPHLNRHCFTDLFGRQRIVCFKDINCTLVVARRGPDKDEILLPVLIRHVDALSVDELEAIIRDKKSQPLASLPEMQAHERVRRLPRLALSLFSYKVRSDPAFYQRYFGTYGLSSLVRVGGHGSGGATVANTGVAFLPGTIRRQPRFIQDEGKEVVAAREILTFGIVFDHLVFDGIQMVRATERLATLIEKPDLILGPASSPSTTTSSSETSDV